jgi:hypothetical protein
MYENFILEMEWKHLKAKGNSGLFVWADALPAVGSQFTRSIEVQILDGVETENYTSDGDIFSIWGADMTPDRPHPAGWKRCLPSEKRSKPAGQWNHYRLEAKDGSLKLAVNGKVVSGGSKCTPRKGYLCLEAEGSECHFRNLKIKELPSTNPSAKDTAQEGKGHVTLFTGLDLSGWTVDDANKGHWTAASGPNVLRYDGKVEGGGSIRTTKEYGDVEVVCDVRLPKADGEAGLILRGGARYSTEGEKGGKWKRIVGLVKAGDAKVKHPVVLHATSTAEFCNLFIRELK